jgi:predicted nuclease with TOPRIM domain
MVALKCAIKHPSGSNIEVDGIRFVPWNKLKKLGTDAIDKLIDEVVAILPDLQRQVMEMESELRGIDRFGNKNVSRYIQIRLQLSDLVKKRGTLQEYFETLKKRYQELEKELEGH